MTEPTPVLLPVEVLGTTIHVLEIDLGQLALIQHQSRVLQRNAVTPGEGQRALSLVFRVLLNRVPDNSDREIVEDAIAEGGLTIESLLKLIVNAMKAHKEADEKAPATGPVVRRGRPRKQS